MPSVPQPAFVPETTKIQEGLDPLRAQPKQTEGKGDEGHMIEEDRPRGRSSSEGVNFAAGPWDRSRTLREGELSTGNLVQPPAAAVSLPRG